MYITIKFSLGFKQTPAKISYDDMMMIINIGKHKLAFSDIVSLSTTFSWLGVHCLTLILHAGSVWTPDIVFCQPNKPLSAMRSSSKCMIFSDYKTLL